MLAAGGAAAVTLLLAGCGASDGASSDASAPTTKPAATSSTPTATTPTTAPAATTPATASPEGYDPTRDAAADVTAAERASAKDGRPVLIDFGADWCPDCVVLGRTFTEPATAALLAKYHVVRVDVGQFDHNLSLAARYVDLDSSGIPALAVVDRHGTTETATNQGQFSNARSMPESQVDAFLKTWA
ncbi:thioredoxin family protein [Actinacidiphila sp. bgisy145]|uniref:thioredoxin family protein n=1 Tax=Actinacidiphila sp. bgisy145 TaxID=3413792 RepID=UPI003EBF7115